MKAAESKAYLANLVTKNRLRYSREEALQSLSWRLELLRVALTTTGLLNVLIRSPGPRDSRRVRVALLPALQQEAGGRGDHGVGPRDFKGPFEKAREGEAAP